MTSRVINLDDYLPAPPVVEPEPPPEMVSVSAEWLRAVMTAYRHMLRETEALRYQVGTLQLELANARAKIERLSSPSVLVCEWCRGDGRGCRECRETGEVQCGSCGEFGAVKVTQDAGAVCAACLALAEEVG